MTARLRPLALPLYLLALLMCILPLADLLPSLHPAELGSARWRYGAIGLLSNALLVPLAGMVLATATAVVLEHARTRRFLAVLSLAGALVLLAAMGDFALDALELRTLLRPEAKATFIYASALGLLKQVLAFVMLAGIGVGQLRGEKRTAKRAVERMPLLAHA